ncbi:MAG: signal peptidase II [Halothiobacillus sp.]
MSHTAFKPGRLYWGNLSWLLLSLVVIAADAASKWAASTYLHYATALPITGFFNLTLLHNHGAAFSFLANSGGWQRWGFAVLAGLVAFGLLVWLLRIPRRTKANCVPRRTLWVKVAIALIIGGALGNLIDRLNLGYVVDFLDFHAAGYHWPAFNIADSAITLGVILLLMVELVPAPKPAPRPAEPNQP